MRKLIFGPVCDTHHSLVTMGNASLPGGGPGNFGIKEEFALFIPLAWGEYWGHTFGQSE